MMFIHDFQKEPVVKTQKYNVRELIRTVRLSRNASQSRGDVTETLTARTWLMNRTAVS